MIEINKTPVRTSQNYGINSVTIDENDIEVVDKNFSSCTVNCDNQIQICDANCLKIVRPLSSEFEKQSNCNGNFNKQIYIKNDAKNEKKVDFLFDFDKNDTKLAENLSFHFEKDTKTKVILKYVSSQKSYHNGVLDFDCGENSNVDILIFSNLSKLSNNFLTLQANVEKNAKLNVTIVDIASHNSIQNVYVKVVGENAISNLNSLYFGDDKNRLDLNYIQDVFGIKARTEIEVVGALTDFAKKNFKGTINFEKGCKKAFGSENETCLLLSKNSKSKALPMLLCGEEDVDGKHSSSVGKADEKELFYIMSRGLSYQEALKLSVKAKFSTVLNKVFDEELKKEILNVIDRKFDYEK